MLSIPRPSSNRYRLASRHPRSANPADRVLIAGLALLGTGLVVANPATPALPDIQHRAVQLTAGGDEMTWTQVLSTAEANLLAIQGEAATANSDLSSAVDAYQSVFQTEIGADLSAAENGVQQAISGGYYGDDDGYVFGLFEGSLTSDTVPPVTETGSTLQEISTALEQGNLFNAFAYFDTFSLEAFDHIVHPLLDPFLNDTSDSNVTTLPIPGELLQTLTNVYDQLFSYDNVVTGGNALLSPEISAALALTADLDNIGTEFSTGDYTDGLTNLSNLSSDVVGAFLNGYTQINPVDGDMEPFTGLTNTGSLLYELLVDGPTQLATALTQTTAEITPSIAADSAAATAPDLLGGLF